MKNKVYYGEYSLSEWIRLLLSFNIEIPPYQRHFVWDKETVKDLIKSFKKNKFVPPITICKVTEEYKTHNYIVDGQQRLTALLMYKYNFYYDARKIKTEEYYDENKYKNYDEWTLNELLINIKENDIKEYIDDKKKSEKKCYSDLFNNSDEIEINDESLLRDSYLGFSYIILEDVKDLNEQQRYYAELFNEINTKGVSLEPSESRRAYYFINSKYKNLFNLQLKNIDFMRYLAILSEYKKSATNLKNIIIAKNTGNINKMEKYIINYIVEMSKNVSEKFVRIEEIFADANYENASEIVYLKQIINYEYYKFDEDTTIIDKDIKLFGLIYVIVFLHKRIDETNIKNLKNELNCYIDRVHADPNKYKSPRNNKYLNERLIASIEIYEKYMI